MFLLLPRQLRRFICHAAYTLPARLMRCVNSFISTCMRQSRFIALLLFSLFLSRAIISPRRAAPYIDIQASISTFARRVVSLVITY